MERLAGFYWTKLNGSWRVCRWSDEIHAWYLAGVEESYESSEFDEINETRILPPQ